MDGADNSVDSQSFEPARRPVRGLSDGRGVRWLTPKTSLPTWHSPRPSGPPLLWEAGQRFLEPGQFPEDGGARERGRRQGRARLPKYRPTDGHSDVNTWPSVEIDRQLSHNTSMASQLPDQQKKTKNTPNNV